VNSFQFRIPAIVPCSRLGWRFATYVPDRSLIVLNVSLSKKKNSSFLFPLHLFHTDNNTLGSDYEETLKVAKFTLFCYVLGTPVNSAIPVDIGKITKVDNVDIPIENLTFGHIKKLICI